MNPRRIEISLTTNLSGAVTAYSENLKGILDRIEYVKTDFADGVDFDITLENSGTVLLDKDDINASAIFVPRQAVQTTAGVAALYASGGVAVLDKIVIAEERVKVVIANGGNTKTGKVYLVVY